MAPGLPSHALVYVADREADLMALMERADALGKPADWLVRATHNRACLRERSCGSAPRAAKRWAKSPSRWPRVKA